MTPHRIVDTDLLVSDLRMAVDYAARAGLIGDATILSTLSAAEASLEGEDKPNIHAITKALNDVTRIIAPITLVDIRAGRSPFVGANERRSQNMQFLCAGLALVMLLALGALMKSLRAEQDAVQALSALQEQRPQLRLTALRKMARFDGPITSPPSLLFDKFKQEIVELRLANGKVASMFKYAKEASDMPLFPGTGWLVGNAVAAPAEPDKKGDKKLSSDPRTIAAALVPKGFVELEPPGPLAPTNLCAEDDAGNIQLPATAYIYPVWMRKALADELEDMCFQLKVLFPTGNGALLDEGTQVAMLPSLKEKVSMRVGWVLPFAYGLLGATLFLMRNVTNVRVPAMGWLGLSVRLALGGVTGIVVGWFAVSSTPSALMNNTLSAPFALAFIAGYGIEVVFSLMERLNRMIGEPAARGAA